MASVRECDLLRTPVVAEDELTQDVATNQRMKALNCNEFRCSYLHIGLMKGKAVDVLAIAMPTSNVSAAIGTPAVLGVCIGTLPVGCNWSA